MPRQSKDRARQYGIRRRMGAGEQHTVHKNSLLHLIGERDMGQNDPPRSDELSVTKRQRYVLSKNVVLVKKTHTTQTGYL